MAKLDFGIAQQKARRSFDGFTRGQKTMLVLAGVAVALGAVLMSKWSGQQQYSTLFSNLAPADAASVTSALDAQGVKYQLGSGGASIMVPADVVYKTRIDLSAKGLPTTGQPGYSLLDKQGLTTSDFRQHVDYQRALEGELSKTIGAIDGVQATSVHLVIPQEDLFSGDATKPSASVLVRTLPQQTLSSEQVQAVVHLVASSVEGLSPDDVTVADANGNVLAAPGQDIGAASSSRAEQTTAYEDALALSLQQMVQKVTGDGHAVVKVKAELNYDAKTTTKETYDPATKTAIAEKATKETFNGAVAGAAATGILGPNGVPNTVATTTTTIAGATTTTVAGGATASTTPTAAVSGNSYVKEDSQSDFAIGKLTEQVASAPGAVTRLSVAVLLDGSKKLTAAQTAQLNKLVFAAAGLVTSRGDKLEIGQLPFDTTKAKEAAAQLALVSSTESKKQMFDLVKSVLLGLLALGSVLMAYRGAKKSALPAIEPIPLESIAKPAPVALPPAAISLLDDDDDDDDVPVPVAVGAMTLPSGEPRPDIAALIEKQPEEVANTLREWLADRRS